MENINIVLKNTLNIIRNSWRFPEIVSPSTTQHCPIVPDTNGTSDMSHISVQDSFGRFECFSNNLQFWASKGLSYDWLRLLRDCLTIVSGL
eukprot:598665-Amorphochlora_amoeboformis.AAC.1